jgi:dihydrofolate synthase/folylpolyglutamate synthase
MQRNYTLDRMRQLMDSLGNPQDTYKVVHVAGTSGKTSTSYYMAALLTQTGAKVGLTVSPHIDEVNERVQLNLVPLPEAEYCRELTEFLQIIESGPLQPTYFELLVAFAYWEFARQQVDYAVVEVGLGGLMDGTNVVSRSDKLCIITDIGLDHMAVLGDNLPAIAAQKAGIILPQNDVFVHTQPMEVMQVFHGTAADKQAHLHEIAADMLDGSDLPRFQQRNWTLAKAAFDFLTARDGLPQSDTADVMASQQVVVPGRMEVIQLRSKTIVLDGAHNAQKMGALTAVMRERFAGQSVAVLLAMVEDKQEQLEAVVALLATYVDALIATGFHPDQDLPRNPLSLEAIQAMARQAGIHDTAATADPNQALEQLLARPEPVLLVTGSLYLVAFLRARLRAMAAAE